MVVNALFWQLQKSKKLATTYLVLKVKNPFSNYANFKTIFQDDIRIQAVHSIQTLESMDD